MPLLLAIGSGLIALIITPGALFYFDVTPKIVVLLITAAALLALAAARRSFALPPKWFSILLALSAASVALSTAFSTNPSVSLIGATWREFGLIPQLAVLTLAWFAAALAGTNAARPLLRALALSSAVAALYGIAQYFGVDPFLPAAAYHVGEGIWTIVRPPGTLGYASYFATWLTGAAFLSLALSAIETARGWVLTARIAASLCLFAMLLTGTRAALLGLAAGVVAWLLFRGFRLPRRAWAVIAVSLAAGAAFYFSPAGWNLRSRTRWYIEDPTGGRRLPLWRDSLRMAAAKPFAGYGPETFTAQFPRYESAALASERPDFEYESPHNMFLDAFTAQGFPGFLLLLAFCACGFQCARGSREAPAPWLAAALAAELVCQQFTVFTMPTALLFYLTVALLVPRRVAIAAGTAVKQARPAALALAPLAALFLYCAVRMLAADHALAQTNSAIASNQVETAVSHYAGYQGLRLPGPSSDLWYSRSMLNLSQRVTAPASKVQALAQAYAAAAHSPETSDDPANAWYNLGLFEATRGNSAAVESALNHAVAARPNWFKPHWALARLFQLEGRGPEAVRERTLTIALDGGKHPGLFGDSQK